LGEEKKVAGRQHMEGKRRHAAREFTGFTAINRSCGLHGEISLGERKSFLLNMCRTRKKKGKTGPRET